MRIRLGQDMCLGIGKEASWTMPPTAYKPLTVLQQNLAEIASRRRRQNLGGGQFATKSQLIHAHIGGDISLQLAFGNGDDLLASGVGGLWRNRDISGLLTMLPRGARLSSLSPDMGTGQTAPSFSLLRRFDRRDDWQHFYGLKSSRLRLTIGTGGEAVLGATMIGKMSSPAHRTASQLGNAMPLATVSPPFNLNHAPSALAIQILGAESRLLHSTGDFVLSHLTLTMTRGGMTPLFGLSAMSPLGITDGLLAIDGALHLLYTPSLATLLRADTRLKIQLTIYDEAGHAVVVLLPSNLITNSEIETSSPALPPLLRVQFESHHDPEDSSSPLIAIGMAELDAD
ncbi:phage tail tube protein [Candidatus Puniceispirillum marinum]|uniref:Major facilitator superfamily MFS_1 n=1 Tax=Puniceispirillum marinum (strain IMCC1322) TaxID=488538 RepID=D5BP68_PUNMI|nr:phage tail tube protein [Candidatus Puniceispirillum marinum]ADE40502.1 major facilitator superfamily MFS_1 [Candidatus Puniceispirillum marinum IMCC1322]